MRVFTGNKQLSIFVNDLVSQSLHEGGIVVTQSLG
jgi:hypothetical protein